MNYIRVYLVLIHKKHTSHSQVAKKMSLFENVFSNDFLLFVWLNLVLTSFQGSK